MLNRVRLWIRSVVLRRRLEREMQEEMAEHLRRSAERLMARGLSAEEARREAVREFGNVTYLQEEARFARGTRWLDALLADCRFAVRHFARKPGTTLTMFVVLAVGMSISTLLFSYVRAYAVQPPPGVPLEDDLVRIRGSRAPSDEGSVRPFSEEEFREYRGLTGHFREVAGWTSAAVALDAGGGAERTGLEAWVTFATDNYFPVLGVRPALGPGLPAVERGGSASPAVAVIGHNAWDQLFGRSPEAVGSTVVVNGVPVTVVGVAPERFIGIGGPADLQLWMPLAAQRLVLPAPVGAYRAVARLRPGVGTGAAAAAVQVVAARRAAADRELRAMEPATDVVPLLSANGDPMFDQDVRLMSFSLGLLGLLVLLVTCTNVTALLTGLATARRQEIAIRLSLGAARTRLIRQLLTESAFLACAAAAAALGIVWAVLRTASVLLAPVLPLELEITWPTTLFTFGVALAVGVLFGLSPALHATRLGLAGALRDSSTSIAAARARLQRGLVVAQIAFTQPLVVLLATVLMLVLTEMRPGAGTKSADRLVTLSLRASVPTVGGSSPATGEARRQLRATTRRLAERLEGTPGVEAAVIDWGDVPLRGSYVVHRDDGARGAPRDAVDLAGSTAGEGYFAAMGIPLLRGRAFAPGDAAPGGSRGGEVAAIIGADLARRLWGRADPLGRRLQAASDSASAVRSLVVVGVFEDPRAAERRAGQDYRVFLPPDTGGVPAAVLLRTRGPAEPLLATLRGVAHSAAPGVPVRLRTFAQVEDTRRKYFHMVTAGVSTAGLMALLLSAIGLYAVVAFSVGQRTGEIAVRMAVGARGRQIVRRFVADGLRLSALGLAFGLPASLLGLRALLAADPGMPRIELAPVTAIAALGVVCVAAAAAWIPARRAAAVDPAITLRGG